MTSFVFTQNFEFEWPVVVRYPGAGGMVEKAFAGRFRLPDDEEIAEALFPERKEEDKRSVAELIAEDRARLTRFFVGWSQGAILLEGGAEFPATPEKLQTLLRQRPVRLAVGVAISEAILEGKVRAKN